jgi:hypothetical protein
MKISSPFHMFKERQILNPWEGGGEVWGVFNQK